jgi:hypothetical protein
MVLNQQRLQVQNQMLQMNNILNRILRKKETY